MKFKILSDEELVAISAQLDNVPDLTFGETETRAYLEAQKKHTLKQVVEWGNTYCLEGKEHGRDLGYAGVKKQECRYCWQKLQELAQ